MPLVPAMLPLGSAPILPDKSNTVSEAAEPSSTSREKGKGRAVHESDLNEEEVEDELGITKDI